MLLEQWNNLPKIWRITAYKTWMLFFEHKFPLSTYLWDDSYGMDFLLCKVLNIESSDPEKDLSHLDSIIEEVMRNITTDILDNIFSMEFLSLHSEITYLSPLRYFPNIKVLDFHCMNESKITDFSILSNRNKVYILDYADYKIIDFDKYSNIRDFDNIEYIKEYGFPSQMDQIYRELKTYKIDE